MEDEIDRLERNLQILKLRNETESVQTLIYPTRPVRNALPMASITTDARERTNLLELQLAQERGEVPPQTRFLAGFQIVSHKPSIKGTKTGHAENNFLRVYYV